MSNEIQPPIEDTLKAYAEERRRALGTPPAMPDHVRSRLHRELRAAAEPTARRPAGWAWYLRPWAWAVTAAVAVGIWITWQAVGPKPADVTLVAARPEPAPADLVVPPAETAAAPTSLAAGTRTIVEFAPTPVRPTSTDAFRADLPTAPPLALAAPTLPAAAETAVEKRAATVDTAPAPASYALRGAVTATDTEARRSFTAGTAEAPKSPVPAAATVAGFRDRAGQNQLQQRFTQNRPAQVSPVLNSFQVDQVDRQLRLVDADGSIYLATLTGPAPTQAQAAPIALTAGPPVARANLGQARAQAVPAAAVGAAQETLAPMQVLTLNAVGTNWQLQQQVVFTGNLLVTNLAGVPVVNNSAGLGTNLESLSQLFRNSTVNGLVTVGGTNQYAVEAIPTGP